MWGDCKDEHTECSGLLSETTGGDTWDPKFSSPGAWSLLHVSEEELTDRQEAEWDGGRLRETFPL